MFLQDLTQSLFPIGGDVDGQPVFQLSADDEQVSTMIEAAFAPVRGYGGYGHDMSAVLSAFGDQAVRALLEGGTAVYEVALNRSNSGQAVSFSVFRVDGARSFVGITWQTIPKNTVTGAMWEDPTPVTRRVIRIPCERLVRMKLPDEYRRIPSGLRALRHLKSTLPDFVIQNLNPDGSAQVPYDPQEFTGIEKRAVATITRSTGWNARATFSDAVTSYYEMVRFLRFEEFKARLREIVERTVNRILSIAGAATGFTGIVRLQGLPTLDEITVSRDHLAAGRLDFVKAIKQYSLY